MPPRVAAAQIFHETNGFSSVPTALPAFETVTFGQGDMTSPMPWGTGSELGGFIAGAAEAGFDLLPILVAWATPAGRVTSAAFDHLTDLYVTGLKRALAMGPLAGVLLALHGSMMTGTSTGRRCRSWPPSTCTPISRNGWSTPPTSCLAAGATRRPTATSGPRKPAPS